MLCDSAARGPVLSERRTSVTVLVYESLLLLLSSSFLHFFFQKQAFMFLLLLLFDSAASVMTWTTSLPRRNICEINEQKITQWNTLMNAEPQEGNSVFLTWQNDSFLCRRLMESEIPPPVSEPRSCVRACRAAWRPAHTHSSTSCSSWIN